ncbi:MAG: hypothetical protein JWM95_1471 [Gemmatimonadetes bacterium]|nr:hypothetical protein [Gemmatimonadota bacterium]
MRRVYTSALAMSIMLMPAAARAQATETSNKVANGGISAAGWAGKIDAKEAAQGQVLNNSKLAMEGKDLHVITGPAVTYWNPANKASGDYTVKATFKEPKYMNLNDHPHPYGIMIGGNDLDTDQASFLYCAVYGDGKFIMRGMGPAAFSVNGRALAAASVHKAAGKGEPVEQEIAVSVKGDKVECSVNGAVVGSYDKAAVTGAGKAKSTDGIYGIRFAHNTDGWVSGLTMTKP